MGTLKFLGLNFDYDITTGQSTDKFRYDIGVGVVGFTASYSGSLLDPGGFTVRGQAAGSLLSGRVSAKFSADEQYNIKIEYQIDGGVGFIAAKDLTSENITVKGFLGPGYNSEKGVVLASQLQAELPQNLRLSASGTLSYDKENNYLGTAIQGIIANPASFSTDIQGNPLGSHSLGLDYSGSTSPISFQSFPSTSPNPTDNYTFGRGNGYDGLSAGINNGISSGGTPTFAGSGYVSDNINTQAYLSSNGANAPSSAGGQSSGWQNYDFSLSQSARDFNYGSQSSYASPSNYYGGVNSTGAFTPQGPNVVEGLGTGSYGTGTIDTSFNAINQGAPIGASYDFGGGGFGGFDFDEPILLDINGTGLHITQADQSNMYYDMAGDGKQHKTAWAGAGTGVLAIDANGDGKIDQRNEIVFTEWDETATSDMQALRNVFDSNHDGKLSAGDARFNDFKIIATNSDGSTALYSLAQLGITSIDLTPNAKQTVLADGSMIKGTTTYTRSDGYIGTVGDASLSYDTHGYALQTTTTRNADSSLTIDHRGLNKDGSVANETISTTSWDGTSITTKVDNNGDGVFDNIQTNVKTAGAGGSVMEILTNMTGAWRVTDKTTTQIYNSEAYTIWRDFNGDNINDQVEVHNIDASRATTLAVIDSNADGSRIRSVGTSTSADGFSKTTTSDLDGNGAIDLITTDVTYVGANNARNETIIDYNGDWSKRTTTNILQSDSGGGHHKLVQTDLNNDGRFDVNDASVIVVSANGSADTYERFNGANGALLGQKYTSKSADGLTTVTHTDHSGTGYDRTHVDATVVNADTSRTVTLTDQSYTGVQLGKSITTRGADGRSLNQWTDANGDGHVDQTRTISVVGGASTDRTTNYNYNNGIINSVVKATSADNLTTITDVNNGQSQMLVAKTIDETVKNGDGSSTENITSFAGTTKIGKKTLYSSANGLTKSVAVDLDGNGSDDQKNTDYITLNADGSKSASIHTYSGTTFIAHVDSATSIDRKAHYKASYIMGVAGPSITESNITQDNGTVVDTLNTYNPVGTLSSSTTVTASANGLVKNMRHDSDGRNYSSSSDVTVLNINGSTIQTLTQNFGTTKANSSIINVSANGLTKTTVLDKNGDGISDETINDTIILIDDGSRAQIVDHLASNNISSGKTKFTTSGNGLGKTLETDFNGDGVYDHRTDDITNFNADGSFYNIVNDWPGNHDLLHQLQTEISADKRTTTISTNLGHQRWNIIDRTSIGNDGTTNQDIRTYDNAGTGRAHTVLTASADGLTKTKNVDQNNDGTFDAKETDNVVINANGSKTETYSYNTVNGMYQRVGLGEWDFAVWGDKVGSYGSYSYDRINSTTNISANGLNVTRTIAETNGAAAYNLTQTDNTVINADGSAVRSKSTQLSIPHFWFYYNQGYVDFTMTGNENSIVTTSPNGLNVATKISTAGNGFYDYTYLTDKNLDGSETDTITEYNQNRQLFKKETFTKSADGVTTSLKRDSNGDGFVDHFEDTGFNADGSKFETTYDLDVSSATRVKLKKTTSANGLDQTITLDGNGDNTVDRTTKTSTIFNSDGTNTLSIFNFNAYGVLLNRTTTFTSANTLNTSSLTDLNGDDVADEAKTDITTIAGDGSKTETIIEKYSIDNSLKSKTDITTSADGLIVTTTKDVDGDQKTDVIIVASTEADGVKQIETTFKKLDGTQASRVLKWISGDDLHVITYNYNAANTLTSQTWINYIPNSNGEYNWEVMSANGNVSDTGSHIYDGIVDNYSHGKTPTNFVVTNAVEADNSGKMARVYDIVFDRDMSFVESESWDKYYTSAGNFNVTQLATDLVAKQEFTQKYGTLSNLNFVEQMYQNAYGRPPEELEIRNWVGQLNAGVLTRANFILALADSAEHFTYGNTHNITNNTYNGTGTYNLEHSIDKAVLFIDIERLYKTRVETAVQLRFLPMCLNCCLAHL